MLSLRAKRSVSRSFGVQDRLFFLFPHLPILLLLFGTYVILKLPTWYLGIAYYDDGDTLYHAMSMAEGRVPYKEDWGHHFFGYLLPFLLGGKFLGFSQTLLIVVSTLNQVFTAYGVFCFSRFFLNVPWALMAALLCLSAREPWVLGFFQQYQTNLLMVWSIYFGLSSVKTHKSSSLLLCAFLSGLNIAFDQRCLFLITLPFAAWFWGRRKEFLWFLLSFSSAPLICLISLGIYDALTPFFQQTFYYPFAFRNSGGFSLSSFFQQSMSIYRYLFTETPILLIGALYGLIPFAKKRTDPKTRILLTTLPSLFLIPLLGGRDFDYYTIPWIPLLAFFSAFGAAHFTTSKILTRGVQLFAVCPIVISLMISLRNIPTSSYQGDGIFEVRDFLHSEIQSSDSIFVWAYRLDLYILLRRLSPYPVANRMMIHPDPQIEEKEERSSHIYPSYQNDFSGWLQKDPPTYLVFFEREGQLPLWSFAEEQIQKLKVDQYHLVFETKRQDFTTKLCHFQVYRKKPTLKDLPGDIVSHPQ